MAYTRDLAHIEDGKADAVRERAAAMEPYQSPAERLGAAHSIKARHEVADANPAPVARRRLPGSRSQLRDVG